MTRAALVLVCVLAAGCKHGYSRDDLTVSMGKHHIDLRWGRLENAALAVAPAMRGPFIQAWAARTALIELQQIDVAGVVVSEDGDSADVVVNVTWVERESMTVKSATVAEHWVRTDDGWLADKPLTLT